MYAWWECSLFVAGLILTHSLLTTGNVVLSVPQSVKADDGVLVLEVANKAGFNLTCTSSSLNHSWHFEPADFFHELKEKMSITYEQLNKAGLYNSTLSVHGATYLNTGNYSCANSQGQSSVSVFVKDPDNLLIIKDNLLNVEAGDTLDYLCRPTDPGLVLVLTLEHDYLEYSEELKPGMQYEFMDVYFSRYRGYTLVNMIDRYCVISCYIGNSSELYGSYEVEIHRPQFVDDPEITVQPSATVVGGTIILNCSIKTYNNPSIIWILPDPKMNESGSFKQDQHLYSNGLFVTSTSLTISNAKKAYSGNYTCKAYYHGVHYKVSTKNLLIIDFDVLNLTIINQQLTQKYPPEIEVEPGIDKQEISVKIISNPPLKKTTWYHNREQIYDDQPYYHIYNSDGLATLMIKEPKPKHSGVYTLQAENSKLTETINITVTVQDLVGVEGPDVVVEGDNVSLACGVSKHKSSGDLQWCWTPIDYTTEKCQYISSTITPYTYRVVLNIINVMKKNSGIYTCQESKKIIGNYKMGVQDSVKPNISKTVNTTIHVKAEYPITLYCNTTGVPPPKISWFRDNKPVDLYGIELSNKNQTLSIPKGVDKKTEFKCRALSRVGSDGLTYSVIVEGDYTYLVIGFLTAISILSICIVYFINDYKYKKKIKELQEVFFNEGKIEDLDPELDIADQAALLPYDRKFEFPREKLKLGSVLGSGAFGVVKKGEASDLVKPGELTTVAVKMAKPDSNLATVKALASELKIMIHIGKHLNVVNVLGACTGEIYKRDLLVLVEFCPYGNLHNFLLKNQGAFINQVNPKSGHFDPTTVQPISPSSTSSVFSEEISNSVLHSASTRESALFSTTTESSLLPKPSCSSEASISADFTSCIGGDGYLIKQSQVCKKDQDEFRSVSTQDLVSWSFQIARGMEYLTSKKVLHGDLAARNVLLADNNIVKICDFGLSKSMYKDCYRKMGDDPLPYKWLAPESLQYGLFSSQSDVWAYGVTLWELFSLGRTPYSDIVSHKELIKQLEFGYRMDRPKYATKQMYRVMQDCWSDTPCERPSFSQLTERLSTMLSDLTRKHYLEINETFLQDNSNLLPQESYTKMMQPPTYMNLSSHDVPEPEEIMPMMGNANQDIILVNNQTYNKWAPLNSYVDMKSPTYKAEFNFA